MTSIKLWTDKKQHFTNKEKGEADEDLHVGIADEALMTLTSQTKIFYTKVFHLWLEIQSTWCQWYKPFFFVTGALV